MNQPVHNKWLVQLRKGILELYVLLALKKKGKAYGFELLQLFEQSGLDIHEGTLYPLLNRMHNNDWLRSWWNTPAGSGHPRRFYALSPLGEKLLPEMLLAWQKHIETLQSLEKST